MRDRCAAVGVNAAMVLSVVAIALARAQTTKQAM